MKIIKALEQMSLLDTMKYSSILMLILSIVTVMLLIDKIDIISLNFMLVPSALLAIGTSFLSLLKRE